MKICYVLKRFSRACTSTINKADSILNEYAAQGFVLTLRQLFYQFVARDFIPNTQKSYKQLGKVVGEARLAGLLDWNRLEDRTRNLAKLQHFDGPQDAVDKLASWYHIDMWENQRYRPEVWLEKDALTGVIADVCKENDVPYFSCRGYTSLSEMWRASQRLNEWVASEQSPYVIHFGDHDPSGIDMSRDIYERINRTFMSECEFKRVALNMDQIKQYNPPPNPAKVTDSRYQVYVKKFGTKSWELDALEPIRFCELVESNLATLRDQVQWDKDLVAEGRVRDQLTDLAVTWESVGTNKRRIVELENELTTTKTKLAKLIKKKERRDAKGR